MGADSALRVLWIANLAPPYRVTLWERLGAAVDLQVCLLAETSPGRTWSAPAATTNFSFSVWPTRRIIFREFRVYFAMPGPIRRDTAGRDVVVLGNWDSPVFWASLIIAKLRHIPVVLFWGATMSSQRVQSGPIAGLRRRVVRAADSVLTYGPSATEAALANGANPISIVEGFNGVDSERLRRNVLAHRANMPVEAGHVYLYVGQLIARKNCVGLIDAFMTMADGADRLLIVGGGQESEALQRKVNTTPSVIGERIEFLGHLDGSDLAKVFARGQTLVLPSTNEVWGLVVNEALAAGLHAVVSREAGVARSVEDMRGVFVSGTDPSSLASAMRASRQAWSGWISNPQILQTDANYFGDRAFEAVSLAAAKSPRRRERT